MILGLSLFAGGCSNDQIDDHIISLQDKISDVTASDSTEQEDQEPSTEERVYMDELTGTLLDFDGTHLTISSNGETYVFDVSQTRLECKYGVVSSDQVSVIYQGQLSGTDISTISPIKITDKYHNETPHFKGQSEITHVQCLCDSYRKGKYRNRPWHRCQTILQKRHQGRQVGLCPFSR